MNLMMDTIQNTTIMIDEQQAKLEKMDKIKTDEIHVDEQLANDITQRLEEGRGEALYQLGVGQDGSLGGLTADELAISFAHLKETCKSLNSEVSVICERKAKNGKLMMDLLIRERRDVHTDVRMAVCGNVDAGKSTLVGVLTSGELDNGRGTARVKMLTHKHELESGRTSTIQEQILGFNVQGECVNNTGVHKQSWCDIVEKSQKVITFIDLCGHEKYLKTTVRGMTGVMPDYCFLLVGANMGVSKMTKEHLGLAMALKVPVIVVITKTDICPENVKKQTLTDVTQLIKSKGVKRIPMPVKTSEDLTKVVNVITNDRVIPIFEVSSVSGANIDLLRQFLNIVPPRIQWNLLETQPVEFSIDSTYFVTGVGTVVGGTVMSGTISEGQTLLLGPDGLGNFKQVQVKSIHSKRRPVKQVKAGQSAGIALKKIKRSEVRTGAFLIDPTLSNQKGTRIFEAEVVILFHATTIQPNYQPVVQCLSMRQTAKIIEIEKKELLRTGDRARVKFQFLYHPEYLKVGMRLIFREGRCKGIGIVSKLCDNTVPA
eukprot:TRINITY_DN662_c1_g1_i1.p1 TRINITY_DN662_c1_g1~~TRINITY_DN662_c1_g1_i1.p1  ORF type:complete len:543 (-),score=106.75 TRINITY_DN662_c1_g1_i1:208-1836(-)